jgi:cytidylate kinase
MMESSPDPINIAIDGYSSCGKSTLAKALAARLHYAYVDTGAMYRAITLFALRYDLVRGGEVDQDGLLEGLDRVHIDFVPDGESGKSHVLLNGENVEEQIRSMQVSDSVSTVASIAEVRRKLVKIQKRIAAKKGVVMDGRDIGTVVLPEAELKFFVTADLEVRAERRYRELVDNGYAVSMEEVRKNIRERDQEDMNREESPLKRSDEAILIDTTDLTPQEQLDEALTHFQRVTRSKVRGK